MFLKKKEHLVGLDIGSKTIKAGEISETKSGLQLKRFGTIDIPAGIIEDGAVQNSAELSNYLRELFKLYNINQNNIALSIGGNAGIVKKISLKTMTESELQKVINIEAEHYIPYDISEVNLDFQILGPVENNPNNMNVILAAAKKDVIQSYIDALDEADLNSCIVDIDAFAIQNVYEANYGVQDEYIALIDLGSTKLSLNIIKDGISVFMRDVSMGGFQINHEIMNSANCSESDAEDIKVGLKKSDKIDSEYLEQIIYNTVSDWCAEIGRALDFFYASYSGDKIKKIYICGGGSNIGAFKKLLSEQTSTEVNVLNPFGHLIINEDIFDSDYLRKMAPQAAICMGLAMRRINDK